jgi:hypothetical protein
MVGYTAGSTASSIPTRTLKRTTMKELVGAIAKALVDNPDHVQVRAIEGEHVIVFELRVHPGGEPLVYNLSER